jgi:hypothetical protein
MSDVPAIAGNLNGYKTLADGTLRITVDLSETETRHFHSLFPEVHCRVALAPLLPTELAALQANEPPVTGQYGQLAKVLKLSGFFSYLDVWRATGSDDEFLAFVRTQKCCARSGLPCDGPVQAAHVWRIADGFGKGIKGDYAAVPLCAGHHREQHNGGEDAIGGRPYMEQKRYDIATDWIWETIKAEIGVESMRDAEPVKVLAWAQKRGVAHRLPAEYREAA